LKNKTQDGNKTGRIWKKKVFIELVAIRFGFGFHLICSEISLKFTKKFWFRNRNEVIATSSFEDLEQVNIVSKSFEELIKENFEEYEKDKFVLKVNVCKTSKFKQIGNEMLAVTPTNKILTIETNQVLKVYGYCYFNNQIVVFEI